jgi:hypothetical protein
LCLWLTWIDDCIIIGSSDVVDREKKKMMQLFECDDVGPMEEYVGNKIDMCERTMKLTQPVLLQSFTDEFGVKGSGEQLPAKPGQVLSKGEEKDVLSESMQKKYWSGVGKLRYLTTWSRPDILNAVREVSRFLQAPTQVHYDAMIRIMDYCVSTPERGRKISPTQSWNGTKEFEFVVSGTADAAYNQCPDSRRSVSGNTTEVNGVEATSDNMGVINLINNWSVNNQTRHVANKAMWLRELKEWRILVVAYKPGSEMYSDPLTKNLPKQPYEKHNSHYVVTDLPVSNTVERQPEQPKQPFETQGEQQQARESAGSDEIEDVNEVRDCDKYVRLQQLANCVQSNAHKSNG